MSLKIFATLPLRGHFVFFAGSFQMTFTIRQRDVYDKNSKWLKEKVLWIA
jgi:hypothetical protein